jgi:hypothetical protein
MSDLLDGLSRIVTPERVSAGDEIRLHESNPNSICRPVLVAYRGAFWALRVEGNDHLKLLRGSRSDPLEGFNLLPDWLVFCAPSKRGRRSHDLWALVCELKSGGKRLDRARRQVQLGKLLVEHLVRVAMFALGDIKAKPQVDIRGLLIYPGAPGHRRNTEAGREALAPEVDSASDMAMYRHSDDNDLRIEQHFD